MTSQQSRVRYNFTTETMISLVHQYDSGDLEIPEHQRDYCWNSSMPERFVESIMKGYPCPAVITCQCRTDPKPTIEDGRQRINTASNYRNNKFPWEGKYFKDLTEREQDWFDNYQMMIIKYTNATPEDRHEIFDRFQSGKPLSTGEKYHNHSSTFLVNFVKQILFTPGTGLHDRAARIWGDKSTNDSRRNWLQGGVALISGLAHGMAHMHKKYNTQFLTKEFDRAGVTKDLERILEIFEEADKSYKVNRWEKINWDAGNFVGYIAYSLSHKARINHPTDEAIKYDDGFHKPNSLARFPGEWERLKAGWVAYLCKVRRDVASSTLKLVLSSSLHRDISSARSWSITRWKFGYLRVFEPEIFIDGSEISDTEDESEDEDE